MNVTWIVALASSPTASGQQAERLADRILPEKIAPGTLVVSQLAGLDLAINHSAADKWRSGISP